MLLKARTANQKACTPLPWGGGKRHRAWARNWSPDGILIRIHGYAVFPDLRAPLTQLAAASLPGP